MLNVELEVRNELGIHARVASKITRCCQGFASRVEADRDGKKLNLKNVLNVMLLNVKCGEMLSVEIEGEDEADAYAALNQLFAEKFGEK
ncbi:MAG: HPr family phosphocarrier protein [Oscillospiraceae bacterium]|jgi:phosphocarrier protein|nr:HPr family phosphocarrier protein [Oscillospiraceae bacterium]